MSDTDTIIRTVREFGALNEHPTALALMDALAWPYVRVHAALVRAVRGGHVVKTISGQDFVYRPSGK